MEIDLTQKIQELKDQADNFLINRQNIFIKKNKAKENLDLVVDLINQCLGVKQDVCKHVFDCFYYGNNLGEKTYAKDNVFWRFKLYELDSFCDIDVSVNSHNELWLFIKNNPNPKYFFYIIKDDNWRFAKVAYKSVYYRCGFNSELKQREFDSIDMREIKWINSIEDLVDSILIEVVEKLKEQLKK